MTMTVWLVIYLFQSYKSEKNEFNAKYVNCRGAL